MQASIQVREDLILELCALSGDFPASLLDKLDGSERWSKSIVTQLIKDGLIRRYRRDSITSLRLTKRGRTLLLRSFPERFTPLFSPTAMTRARQTNLTTRLRCHRMAGAYLPMLELGILVHHDEKTDIFSSTPEGGTRTIPTPSFYSSLEIKGSGPDSLRIKGTRAVGTLLTEGQSFIVYNTLSTPMVWSLKSEHKLSGVIQGTMLNWGQQAAAPKGIMFGQDMGTLLHLLRSEGGDRKRLYRVDETYPAFFYIPLNSHGKDMLRLFCSRPAIHRIKAKLQKEFVAQPLQRRYPCDAIVRDRAVLFAWDLDMVKLRHFHDGLDRYGEQGLVLCMEFQKSMLVDYFGNLADIQTLDREFFIKELSNGS